MATRTIVTSQPDVACDVCARRLLRGEQPDVFLAAGRRRTVCELCVPRAVHEGWLRETDGPSMSLPPLRPRRGRSLFDRLRQVGRPTGSSAEPASLVYEPEAEPYDFLEGNAPRRRAAPQPPAAGDGEQALAGEAPEAHVPRTEADLAVEAFNISEHPRRVAGVARSLGAPEINVRSAEHARSVVRIVIAWELCWYRYEVDLDEPEAGTRVAEQGTELGELTREDRLVNAVADDAGVLSLSGS
jgi:hypothetical protein